jgi:hypothetical protein
VRKPAMPLQGDIRDGERTSALVKTADIMSLQTRIADCATEHRLPKEVMVDATFDLHELCVERDVAKTIIGFRVRHDGRRASLTERYCPYKMTKVCRTSRGKALLEVLAC